MLEQMGGRAVVSRVDHPAAGWFLAYLDVWKRGQLEGQMGEPIIKHDVAKERGHITPGDVPPIEVVERTPKGMAWSTLPDGFVRIQRADGETWVFYYRTRNDIFPAAMMLAPGTANLRGCSITLKGNNMDWGTYFMGAAKHAASKSKDTTKVGAVLVSSDNVLLLQAYNGPPRGVADRPGRFERPDKYLYAAHAEANLVAFAARQGVRTMGATIYCTHHPCSDCAKLLIQSGIKRVVYGDGTTSMPGYMRAAAEQMFCEAEVGTFNLHE